MPIPQQTVYRFSRSFLRKKPPWSFTATGDPQGELYVTHTSLPDCVTLNSWLLISIMLSAVMLRNEYVTDCIPGWTLFCIEFHQTLFLRVMGSGAARLPNSRSKWVCLLMAVYVCNKLWKIFSCVKEITSLSLFIKLSVCLVHYSTWILMCWWLSGLLILCCC